MSRIAALIAFLASLIVVGGYAVQVFGTGWFLVALAFSIVPLIILVNTIFILVAIFAAEDENGRTFKRFCAAIFFLLIVAFVYNAATNFDPSRDEHFRSIHAIAIAVWILFIAAVAWLASKYQGVLYRRCPYCLNRIRRIARKCHHCHEWVLPVPPPPE